jgi:hypothetical protein
MRTDISEIAPIPLHFNLERKVIDDENRTYNPASLARDVTALLVDSYSAWASYIGSDRNCAITNGSAASA